MNKKMYLASLKLVFWHALYLFVALAVYYLLVNVIFRVDKLFDVFRINFLFNFLVFITSFILAVKTIKRKEANILTKHRLFLLCYALNIFVLVCLIVSPLIFFKGWSISAIFLILLLAYIYYYFCRLIYREAFRPRPWLSAAVLGIVILILYLIAFTPSFIDYQKEYEKIKVSDDFTYYHKLDLSAIVGERELENNNSAREIAKLAKLTDNSERITDSGEQLSYIVPTKEQMDILSAIAGKDYLSFSKEFLSEKARATGATMTLPLSGLRYFSYGVAKTALLKYEAGSEEEAKNDLNNLLLAGNQMIDAGGDSSVVRSVGESMIRKAFGVLTQIYGDDSLEAAIISAKTKELDSMGGGSQSLKMYLWSANEDMIGSSKNAALFFKHLDIVKNDVGGDFDFSLAKYFLSKKTYLNESMIDISGNKLEDIVAPVVILPVIVPYLIGFEMNIGNDYVIYREMKKLSKEPGHELLKNYFSVSYSDFLKEYNEASEEASSVFYTK
jgi:hypothetical protein